MVRYTGFIAAISGFLAVSMGAFGAHGLKEVLTPQMLATYQTAVHYHFFHTLVLLALAILLRQDDCSPWLRWSSRFFIVGVILFSGSLYLLALGGPGFLGFVTPFGGVAMLAGWLSLALALFEKESGGAGHADRS